MLLVIALPVTRPIPHRIGLYLALVQLLFASTWTVYVLYLPALAGRVGIGKDAVAWILVLDQLIFVGTDLAMGVMADRVARVLGRLGLLVLGITVLSCVAFLLLPLVASPGESWPFLSVVVVWSATSSALRAPPLVLLGKYAAKPAQPWLAGLSLVGLGLAGALAPSVTVALRDVDPRIPFALSSVALAAATMGIIWAERQLAGAAPAPAATGEATPAPASSVVVFVLAAALLAFGFQVHFVLNSGPLYLRFARPAQLAYLMPSFWIGFSLLMLPATWATRRAGGFVVMGAASLIGAMATWGAREAGGLGEEVAMQVLAGGAWGCALMSAMATALALGRTGREGRVTGGLFAVLAVGALARIALVATQAAKDPRFARVLAWTPTAAWAAAGVALLLLAVMRGRGGVGFAAALAMPPAT